MTDGVLQLDPCSTLGRAPTGNSLPRVAGRKGDVSKFSESLRERRWLCHKCRELVAHAPDLLKEDVFGLATG